MGQPELGKGSVTDFWSVAPEDNVATCIREGGVSEGDLCSVSIGGDASAQVLARSSISYGHKIALADIAVGERVTKYGMSIGVASVAICAGEHVHVHNIESERGRGDRAQDPDLQVHVGPWAKWRKPGVAQ